MPKKINVFLIFLVEEKVKYLTKAILSLELEFSFYYT